MTTRKVGIVLAHLVIFGVWIVIYGAGEDSYILIHDNLDSVMTWLRVLRLSGVSYLSASETVPNLMHGVPAFSLSAGFNFGELSHLVLGEFHALAANDLVAKLVAFWGMYSLLRRRVFAPQERDGLAIGVALCFALLPFWPGGFLSVAGQPLLLFAFGNVLLERGRARDWAVIVLYPFCSSLALAGFAVLLMLFVVFLYWIRLRRGAGWIKPLFALVLLGGLSMLASYKILYGMFLHGGFVSHRAEFVPTEFSLEQVLEIIARNFVLGHYQAASLQGTAILLALGATVVLMVVRKRIEKRVVLLGLACASLSLFFGIWLYLKPALGDHLLVRGFAWERLHFLHPILWYLLFAVSLGALLEGIGARRPRVARGVVGLLLLAQAAFVVHGNENLKERSRSEMTYAEFFSEALFREVEACIGLPKESYRVVSLGLHPAVAQYNGFFTLDAYLASYDLDYKRRFRRVIAGELGEDESLRKYYDDWGSRCYFFASELERGFYLYGKRQTERRKIAGVSLNVDFGALYELGGRFLFSSVPIETADGDGLREVRSFEREDSAWNIRLYEVMPPFVEKSGPDSGDRP